MSNKARNKSQAVAVILAGILLSGSAAFLNALNVEIFESSSMEEWFGGRPLPGLYVFTSGWAHFFARYSLPILLLFLLLALACWLSNWNRQIPILENSELPTGSGPDLRHGGDSISRPPPAGVLEFLRQNNLWINQIGWISSRAVFWMVPLIAFANLYGAVAILASWERMHHSALVSALISPEAALWVTKGGFKEFAPRDLVEAIRNHPEIVSRLRYTSQKMKFSNARMEICPDRGRLWNFEAVFPNDFSDKDPEILPVHAEISKTEKMEG
jgi:hypothetical protein